MLLFKQCKAVQKVNAVYSAVLPPYLMVFLEKIFDPGQQLFYSSFLSLIFQYENKLRIDDDIVTAADHKLQEHLTCFLWFKDNVTQTSAVS